MPTAAGDDLKSASQGGNKEHQIRPEPDTEGRTALQSRPALAKKGANIMSINSKVHELRELRQMAEELEAEIETIEDSIKEQMRAQGVDTLHGPDWKVTWKPVTSSRLDTSALKAELPEIAARYVRQTTNRRFCLA